MLLSWIESLLTRSAIVFFCCCFLFVLFCRYLTRGRVRAKFGSLLTPRFVVNFVILLFQNGDKLQCSRSYLGYFNLIRIKVSLSCVDYRK